MPPIANHEACAMTVLKNPTGQTRRYSFLPPHGVTLGPGELYAFAGSILERRSNSAGKDARNQQAFLKALRNSEIRLLALPHPVISNRPLYAVTRELAADGFGNPKSVLPCWME